VGVAYFVRREKRLATPLVDDSTRAQ